MARNILKELEYRKRLEEINNEILVLNEKESKIKEQKDLLKEELKSMLDEGESVGIGNFIVSNRAPLPTRRVDYDTLEEKYPKAYAEVVIEGVSSPSVMIKKHAKGIYKEIGVED